VGECSVRKQASRIRVTFQLLDGRTGEPLWADTYDTTLSTENLFDIQSDIAQQIAQSLRAMLSPEEQARIAERPTDNLEAYNAYLLGRHWWNQRTSEATQAAIEHFQEAVSKDTAFALAYVGLADSYMVAPWYGGEVFISPEEARSRGIEAAERALEIDDGLGEAHASLAALKLFAEWDWAGAEREFQRAIELSPRYAMAHQWYGLLLEYSRRRFDEAEARMRFAMNLDPLYQTIHVNLGFLLMYTDRCDQAIDHLQGTLSLFPGFPSAEEALALAYMCVGRYSDANELAHGGAYRTLSLVALGRREEALALAEQVEQTGSLRERLRARTGIGDIEGAFAILEEAVDRRIPWLLQEPNLIGFYESLHSDPRWTVYLDRIGVEHSGEGG